MCVLLGCEGSLKDSGQKTAAVKTPSKPSFDTELQNLNSGITQGIAFARQQSDGTVIPLEVVSLYLERARLTGNYDDYAKAQTLLASLRAKPTTSNSYCIATARLHYTLHRLKQASAALKACPPAAEAGEVAAIEADIAMYSGRYREAENIYRSLVNQSGLTQQYVRLALIKNRMGSPAEAAALLEAAEKRYYGGLPTMQAWLKLQRGLIALDRGRLDEALALYRLASDALEGWWLIDEHIAEVLLLSGKTKEAKAIYESVVERTGAPEFMDALAAIEMREGNAEKARKLTLSARALYEQRLAAFPEAAAGHALDHFLQDKVDVRKALSLAEKNFDTRPFGESATSLAKALLLSGKPGPAAVLIENQLSKGWDTAEAYWLLGEARRTLGQTVRAELAKREALNRNPHSEKMYSFLR